MVPTSFQWYGWGNSRRLMITDESLCLQGHREAFVLTPSRGCETWSVAPTELGGAGTGWSNGPAVRRKAQRNNRSTSGEYASRNSKSQQYDTCLLPFPSLPALAWQRHCGWKGMQDIRQSTSSCTPLTQTCLACCSQQTCGMSEHSTQTAGSSKVHTQPC